MADAHIEGLDGVLAKMRQLVPKLQKKGLRTAVRKGANVIKKSAVENAKRLDDAGTDEAIWKNIAVANNARAGRKEGGIVMSVGVRGGAKSYANNAENRRKGRAGKTNATGGSKANPGGDTWYWRFLEFGTSRQQAKPFLRPAMADNVERATAVIIEELSAQIDKLVASGVK